MLVQWTTGLIAEKIYLFETTSGGELLKKKICVEYIFFISKQAPAAKMFKNHTLLCQRLSLTGQINSDLDRWLIHLTCDTSDCKYF